jgi:hypothetical protein
MLCTLSADFGTLLAVGILEHLTMGSTLFADRGTNAAHLLCVLAVS